MLTRLAAVIAVVLCLPSCPRIELGGMRRSARRSRRLLVRTEPGESSRLTHWILGCVVGLCLCSCDRLSTPEGGADTTPAVQAPIAETSATPVTQRVQPIPAEAIAAQAIALATEVARPTATPDARVLNPENQHLYLFIGDPEDWHSAQDICASRGGYLVTMQSLSENGFVRRLAETESWLGATDEIEEGTWVWVTGESWDYANWDEGEPNNYYAEGGENGLSFSETDTWNDLATNGPHPFTCEWDPVSP